MADEADRANDAAQGWLDAALRAQASQNVRNGEIGPELCVECYEPLPMVRRKMGAVLCIDCKEREERNGS